MGFDWESVLGTENSEAFEDLFTRDEELLYRSYRSAYDDYPYEDEYMVSKPKYIYADYAHGWFDGKRISFKKKFADHLFSAEEVTSLLKGKTITVSYNSGSHKQKTTKGRLQDKISPEGRKYYGFVPEFSEEYRK